MVQGLGLGVHGPGHGVSGAVLQPARWHHDFVMEASKNPLLLELTEVPILL
jgi:hypothetical protein